MDCKEAKSLIPDLIRDPNTCPRKRSLENHINNCTACYQEFIQAKDTVGKVTDSIDWSKVSPNAKMQREIYKAAKEESERLRNSKSSIGNISSYVKKLLNKDT